VNRLSPSILIIILLTCISASCVSPDKGEKQPPQIIANSMLEIRENVAYLKVGKLKLSDYGLFLQPLKELKPAREMMLYDLNTPLFTDYAEKERYVFIPEGSSSRYNAKGVLEFPDSTILIKNFYYSGQQLQKGNRKIIETRLLIKEKDNWIALPYIWNEEQTEAFLEITGGTIPVQLAGMTNPFEYRVPTMLQCKSCHELNGKIVPIGPTVRQLNRNNKYPEGHQNQLRKMIDLGWLVDYEDRVKWPKAAVWDNEKTFSLEDRARSYLDINCGHCHRPGGPGKNSGLDLTVYAPNEHSLGIMKAPVAAGAGSGGLLYDIVPDKPDESILVFRMQSQDPGIMMPELGRSLIHQEGIELVEEWISSLD
jgi:uncharacterized repeat protein (TIGR03806 family)